MHDELRAIRRLQEETLVLRGEHLAALEADDRILAELDARAAALEGRHRRKPRHLRAITIVSVVGGVAAVAEMAKAQPAAAAAVALTTTAAVLATTVIALQPGTTTYQPAEGARPPSVTSPTWPPSPTPSRRPKPPGKPVEPVEPVEPAAPKEPAEPAPNRPLVPIPIVVTPSVPDVGKVKQPKLKPPLANSTVPVPPVEPRACQVDINLPLHVRLRLCDG